MKKTYATVGTNNALGSYKGLEGELSFTSDTRKLSVHDGTTSGGRQVVLIQAGDGEPSSVPDHVNQLYVNRDDNALYVAQGTLSANDWKLVAAESQELSGSLLVDTIGSYQTALTPEEQEKVTDALIAAETIRGQQLQKETITAQQVQADTLTSREIAAGTILASNIKANELSSSAGVFGVISVNELGAGTISASNIFVGSSRFHLDGANERISINDENGTLRTRLGNFGTNSTSYGLELYDSTGALIVGFDGLGNGVVNGVSIANGAVSASAGHISDLSANDINTGTLDASVITVTNLDASNITTGNLTADFISGGTLQLTTGMEVTNDSGTTIIDANGIVASQIFVGDLSGSGSLAQQSSVSDSDITSIDGGKIFTNSISANKLNVTNLAAIKADLGKIKAGDISALEINTNQIATNTSGYIEFNNIVEFGFQTIFNNGITSFGSMTIYDPIYIRDGIRFDNPTSSGKFLYADDGSTIIRSDGTWVGKQISGARITGEVAEADNSDKLGNVLASSYIKTTDGLEDITGGTFEFAGSYLEYNSGVLIGNGGGDVVLNAGQSFGETRADGNLSATGTKPFDIPHKSKPGYRLRHYSMEGPEVLNFYRFEVEVVDDNLVAEIELPEYFVWLNTDIEAVAFSKGHFGRAYCETTEHNTINVVAEASGRYGVWLTARRCDDGVKNTHVEYRKVNNGVA